MGEGSSRGRYLLGAVGAGVLALGIAGYWHSVGKPPIEVAAADLLAAYLKNAAAADQQFAGRSLQVTGIAGSTQLEGDDYILTLVPGIQAHLGSRTAGANLFEQVTLLCDGVAVANGTIDLDGCEIMSGVPGQPTSDPVADISLESACDDVNYGHAANERVASAFEAATGHRNGFCVVEEAGPIVTRPLELLDLPSGRILLTERENQDGCHGCNGGAIGIFYLTEHNGKFRVTGKWPEAVEGWSWGKPPPVWYLTTNFTTSPAIYAENGHMGQGYEHTGASLTELGPNGPVTSDPIATGYSDEGAVVRGVPCILKGKIANIVKDRSFEVRVTGFSEFTDHYVQRGGKFINPAGHDWDDICD